MWPKRRLFGIDPRALKQELVRQEAAVRARLGELERESARMRSEVGRLQAEVAMLQTLERDLKVRLSEDESPFRPDLESHLLGLQHLQAEIGHIRSLRREVLDRVREALLPYLGERAKEGRQCLRSGA